MWVVWGFVLICFDMGDKRSVFVSFEMVTLTSITLNYSAAAFTRHFCSG